MVVVCMSTIPGINAVFLAVVFFCDGFESHICNCGLFVSPVRKFCSLNGFSLVI